MGHFFLTEGARCPLTLTNQLRGCAPFQDSQKPRTSWKPSWPWTEKDLKLHVLNCACPACPRADPHLCDFLEDQDEKGIKKMGNHLTHPCRRDGPQAGLGEYLFERLTLKHD